MLSLLSKPTAFRSKSLTATSTLVVANSDEGYLYLLASPKGKKWQVESFGEIQPNETCSVDNPEAATDDEQESSEAYQLTWDELLSSNWEVPAANDIKGRRVILCLQRPDIEFYPLQILPDPQEDLTESIQNELTIREKISLDETVVDYVSHTFEDDTQVTFAATVPQSTLDRWRQTSKQNSLKLEQCFVRALATAQLFEDLDAEQLNGSCLAVAVYGQQADLILLHQRKPCFIRNLVLPNDLSEKAITELLLAEIRLSVSTLDLPFLDDALSNSIVIADSTLANELIIQLKMELDIDGIKLDANQIGDVQLESETDLPTRFIPLLGSLQTETLKPGQQVLDFMNIKQPVEPPSMVRRIVLLGVLLSIVLGYFGMDLHDQYNAEFAKLKKIQAAGKKDKASYEDKLPDAKLVQYVQRWQNVEVQWLEQLQSLTDKLPSGDLAVIRQFSGEQTPEGAKITLQIHVRDFEVSTAIEKAIAESELRLDFRQVVETSDRQFPFRLDTTVFAPTAAEAEEEDSST